MDAEMMTLAATVIVPLLALAVSVRLARSERVSAHQASAAERQAGLDTARRQSYEAFLSAADRLVLTIDRLPRIDPDQREDNLAQAATTMRAACAAFDLLAPDSIATAAAPLRAVCLRMEHYALDRAVVRAALETMEKNLHPGEDLNCRDPSHTAAYLAWELLLDWAHYDDERVEKIKELAHMLAASHALEDAHIRQVLEVAAHTTSWPDLIGPWGRDLPAGKYAAARKTFVRAAAEA